MIRKYTSSVSSNVIETCMRALTYYNLIDYHHYHDPFQLHSFNDFFFETTISTVVLRLFVLPYAPICEVF